MRYAYRVRVYRNHSADMWVAACPVWHQSGYIRARSLGCYGSLPEVHRWATQHAATCTDLHWANAADTCPSCWAYGRVADACPVCLGRGWIKEAS